MKKVFIFIISCCFAVLLFKLQLVWAQSDAAEEEREDRVEESISAAQAGVKTSAQELIEMLKQRALRKSEAARHEQLWATKGTLGLHLAYDNNVNTDSDREGSEYFEQYFSFNWTPTFNDYLGAEIGPWYYGDVYTDTRDSTLLDFAFKTLLKYFPKGDPYLEIQPGVEIAHVHYPEGETSSYQEQKAFVKIKHKFWKRWSQEGKFEASMKDYDKKHPRALDTASTSYIRELELEKDKHSLEYVLGFPVGSNNIKIKAKGYHETSNDHYKDYYDVWDWKVTGELGRSIIKDLYAKVSTAYERKNYQHRDVISPSSYAVNEYDDIYTHKLDCYYTLKKGWTLSYNLTYKKSDSNYAVYDYDKMSHKAGIYISF